MPNPGASSPADPQVLTRFHEELARAAAMPGLAAPGPALWPRFAGYYQGLTRLPRRLRRALQRRWRRSLAGIAFLCALGQAPALAATINVGGGCTLIDAITAANTDTATGGCPAGSGADTLTLENSSVHTLTSVNNTTFGPIGLPVVSSVITIEGNGSTIIRDSGAPDFRIIAVNGTVAMNGTGNLTLNETTVSGGKLMCCGFSGGGGIANFGGAVTLTRSTVSGNSAEGGGGVVSYYEYSTVTLINSTISGNNSAGFGGGVSNAGPLTPLTLTNSTVSGNTSTSRRVKIS